MRRRGSDLVTFALLFAFMSGCSSLDIPDHPEAPEYREPPAPPVDWTASGNTCRSAQLVILVDFSQTVSFLPVGFEPLDAAVLLGQEQPTGQAALVAVATECRWLELEDILFASTGVLVRPPMPNMTPAVNVYEIERFVPEGAYLDNLTGIGWPARPASSVSVNPGHQTELAARPMADVRDAGGPVFSFDGLAATQQQAPGDQTRTWRVTETGFGYVETELDDPIKAGGGMCDVSGSRLAAAASCGTSRVVITATPIGDLTFAHHWEAT